jgi:hypothetical protein
MQVNLTRFPCASKIGNLLDRLLGAKHRETPTGSPLRRFLVVAIILFVAKLLLISRREMVPEPNDAVEYVSISLDHLGSVFTSTAGHPPGAALVMALARSLGIPYRAFLELFLALAAFLFLRPLVVSIRLGILATTLTYGLLLFHPALILEMDRAMSDSVALLWWLTGIGGIIGFVAAPREKIPRLSLGLAIVAFGFVGITRSSEGTIVAVEMIAIALFSVLMFRGTNNWRRPRALIVCLSAVTANFSATQALSATHYLNSGLWGASTVESREWWQLYNNLLSLPVQHGDRHALVNNATMEMAASLSEDFHSVSTCSQNYGPASRNSSGEFFNYAIPWIILECLPGETSAEQYAKLVTISAEITLKARARHLQLSAPILGIIPKPVVKWLSDLPMSFHRLAFEAVRIPDSTRVAQSSLYKELFDLGLLRRTALVAAGENPEIAGYHVFIRITYTTLAALFWPSVPLVFLALAATVICSPRTNAKTVLIAFALSVMIIDVFCRISFYSMVDWMLWRAYGRFMIGARVLTVLVVSTLFTIWLASALEGMLRSKSMMSDFDPQ